MTPSVREILASATKDRAIVRINQLSSRENQLSGYVAGMGPEWFAVKTVSDDIEYDGHCFLRYADVSDVVSPAPNMGFMETVLRHRSHPEPKSPEFDLGSALTILESASVRFPLLSFNSIDQKPGDVRVGHILDVSRGRFEIRGIDPFAQWSPEPEVHRIDELRAIECGDAYLEALWLVGQETLYKHQ